jgi:hypothetical protein
MKRTAWKPSTPYTRFLNRRSTTFSNTLLLNRVSNIESSQCYCMKQIGLSTSGQLEWKTTMCCMLVMIATSDLELFMHQVCKLELEQILQSGKDKVYLNISTFTSCQRVDGTFLQHHPFGGHQEKKPKKAKEITREIATYVETRF